MNQPEAMVRLHTEAIMLAHQLQQTVGEKNDFYITCQQLEDLIRPYVEYRPVELEDLKIRHYNDHEEA